MSEKLSCKSFDFLVKNGDNKDMWGTRFNQLVLLVSSFGLLLVFQNCGENAAVDPLIQNELLLSENQQICTDCSSAGSFLWLSIREYDPYKIDISTVTTHFFVSGQCGTSNFANHSFHWELREGFGAQNLVGRGTSDNRCDTGQLWCLLFPMKRICNPIGATPCNWRLWVLTTMVRKSEIQLPVTKGRWTSSSPPNLPSSPPRDLVG
jgi:hypothetical protein